ncbi:UAA transporter [Syncephalis fuscata]|nr:UAA transporter [Syncephalis fuscata]
MSNTSGSAKDLVKSVAQISLNQWLLVLSLIAGGCCSDLVTFMQFLFVAIEGFVGHFQPSRYGLLKPRAVPIKRWLYMVALFYTLSMLNNRALGYQISMPLHIVFRSGGLLVNMIFGWLLAGKRYTLMQVGSIMLVTAGVVMATVYSNLSSSSSSKTSDDNNASYTEWLIGISLLVMAMFFTAGLGLLQEKTYATYGKHWRESMFYVHFLSLPIFFFVRHDMMKQFEALSASPLIDLHQWTHIYLPASIASITNLILPSVAIPELWIYLALNILTQYICISGVNRLTSIASSLTVNLILNIRKMISLLLSVWIFGNRLGLMASLGCALVFLGTLLYSYAGTKQSTTTTTTISSSNTATKTKLEKQQ